MSRNHSDHERSEPPGQASRRELDIFDLAAFVWTQMGVAIVVALIAFIPLAALVMISVNTSYEATSRLLVILDDSDLTPGAAGTGGAFILDQVMESEAEIFNSDAVRRRALMSRSGAAHPDQIKILSEGFKLERAPNASILVAQFEADDPRIAANTLNSLVDAYLEYRVELLIGSVGGALEGRLAAAEAEAERAQDELRAFLRRHRITDFDTEMTSVLQRVADLEIRRLAADAEAASATAYVSSLEDRLRQVPDTIDLYIENDVTGQLLALRVEREDLLARYLPEAPPVQAIERQIAVLQRFIDRGAAEGQGQTRTGINPVWQELQQEKLRQESFRDSQIQLRTALASQITVARRQADRLRAIAPEYNRLERASSARAEAAAQISLASADASARQSAPTGSADAVRVVERATPPAQGQSLRMPALAVVFILSVGLGVLVALLRGYWVSVRSEGPHPTPRRSQRQTKTRPSPQRKLPVLAKVPQYEV